MARDGCRGGLWPPVRSGATVPSVILRVASLCHSERSEESVTPVFVRDRDTPSVTFGDSSLKEGAKDERYGFFGLRPQNDVDRECGFPLCVGRDDPARQQVPYGNGGRPQAAPTKMARDGCRGGLWPPVRSGATVPSVILRVASLCHSERSEESVTPVFVRDRDTPSVTFGDSSLKEGAKDERYGFFGLRPQNDVDRECGSPLCVGRDDPARQQVSYGNGGRPQAAPTWMARDGCRGGLWPPAAMWAAFAAQRKKRRGDTSY